MKRVRIGAALAAIASLAACEQPSWRNPATSRGSAPPPAAVLQAMAAPVTSANMATDHRVHTPRPDLPNWAVDLIGKPFKAVYSADGKCVGSADGVTARYDQGRTGSAVIGWGWDAQQKAPVGRVVLVDADFRIEGAGESGSIRTDVSAASPAITSDTTGWTAITPRTTGPLDAFGVLADGHTACKLGHVDL